MMSPAIYLGDPEPPQFLRLGPTWYHEIPYLPYGWEALNDRGSGTLKHAAMKEVLRDQSLLAPELFDHVPWHLAEYLWNCLERCNKQTMHMWKIMHTVYPEQFRELSPYYCLHAWSPGQPLTQYMDILNDDDIRWRAVLTVGTNFCSATEIAAIPKIKNLVGLDICTQVQNFLFPPSISLANEGQPLQDGFVRGWVESNALQHLRVIRFCNQNQITIATLRALRGLPELQLIVAFNCRNIIPKVDSARDRTRNYPIPMEGWSACRLEWFRKYPWTEEMIDEHLSSLFYLYKKSLQTAESKPSSVDTELPILEFRLQKAQRADYMGKNVKEKGTAAFLFTRSPMELEHDAKNTQCEKTKKREPPESSGRPAKRAIMKERGPVDISKTLNEFF